MNLAGPHAGLFTLYLPKRQSDIYEQLLRGFREFICFVVNKKDLGQKLGREI